MKKTCGGSTSDIISHLPDNVKETILMCLPIQDGVRTSVLSRKWRYMWVKLPQLVFDDMFCRESIRTMKNKLMMTIYEVLLLHRGPILKFALSLCGLESCPEIDKLILFVINNGIQDFTLRIWKGEPYKLPSSLFSCQQLEQLALGSCTFKPPPEFKGFSRLLNLELCKVVITADIFSSLISSCPLLEQLILKNSASLDYLEIAAPNLKLLICEGLFSSICFKNTPQLARVTICLNKCVNEEVLNNIESSKVMPFDSLPAIEFLQLDYYYAKFMAAGGLPKRLPTTLCHLKILTMYSICFGELDEVSVVLCLLRSSPNLAKIKIEVHTDETASVIEPVLGLVKVQGLDVSLNQLRQVEIQNFSGTRSELEFIKLLLAISPMLKTMLIKPNPWEVAGKGMRILRKLTRFRRSSPQAEIVYEKFR